MKTYIQPQLQIISATPMTILMGSNRVKTDIGIKGGDKSGNVAEAF